MGPVSNTGNFFGVRVSQPGTNVNVAGPSQLQYQDNYATRIFYDNQGNERVIFGLQPDGTYGLRVSLPGTSATSNANLSFNSQQITGTYTFPSVSVPYSGNVVSTQTIAHGLGYVPNYDAIMKIPLQSGVPEGYTNISDWAAATFLSNYDGLEYDYVIAIDTTNLYIQLNISNSTGPGSINSQALPVQYYISEIQVI